MGPWGAGPAKIERIERRLRCGDARYLDDELVTIEDRHLMELLKRKDAFPTLGRRVLLGTFGRIAIHSHQVLLRLETSEPTAVLGSAEVALQPAGVGTDLSRGDSQAPPVNRCAGR